VRYLASVTVYGEDGYYGSGAAVVLDYYDDDELHVGDDQEYSTDGDCEIVLPPYKKQRKEGRKKSYKQAYQKAMGEMPNI